MKAHPALQYRGVSRTQTGRTLSPIRRIIHPDRITDAAFLVINEGLFASLAFANASMTSGQALEMLSDAKVLIEDIGLTLEN